LGQGDELDFAILQERHQDSTEINQSMQQINEIQKGKIVREGGY
jgi:hypothetical protein